MTATLFQSARTSGSANSLLLYLPLPLMTGSAKPELPVTLRPTRFRLSVGRSSASPRVQPAARLPLVTAMLTLVANSDDLKLKSRNMGASRLSQR